MTSRNLSSTPGQGAQSRQDGKTFIKIRLATPFLFIRDSKFLKVTGKSLTSALPQGEAT